MRVVLRSFDDALFCKVNMQVVGIPFPTYTIHMPDHLTILFVRWAAAAFHCIASQKNNREPEQFLPIRSCYNKTCALFRFRS